MASLFQVEEAIQSQVVTATTGLTLRDQPISVQVGIDWPPTRTLQAIAKSVPPGAIVSVADRRSSKDTTRWLPSAVSLTVTQATIQTTPSTQVLPPGGICHVILSGSPTVGDAVSVIVTSRQSQSRADPGDGSYTTTAPASAVASAGAADDPVTMAAALATTLGAVSGLYAASASGGTVTITSMSTVALTVQSYAGNGGTVTTEIGRRLRDMQITVWTPLQELRGTVGSAVEELIAQIQMFRGSYGQFQSGLVLRDGSSALLRAVNDYSVSDGVLTDLYRRDFIVSVDYPVTTVDILYSVLVPVLETSSSYGPSVVVQQ